MACELLGPKCHVDMKEALTSQDMDVLTSLRVLRSGNATAACLGFVEEECHMTLETAMEQNRSHVVQAILRLQARANLTKSSDRRAELSRDRLKRDLIAKLRNAAVGVPSSTESSSSSFSSSSSPSSSRSSSVLESLESTLREEDGRYGSMSRDEPDDLSVCNAPGQQTSHCYCEVLGQERCASSLFAAYLSGDHQVLSSIRELLSNHSGSSAALDMCRALGPHRCRQSISDAIQSGDIGIVAAWRFLVNGTLPRPAERQMILNPKKNDLPRHCDTSSDCNEKKSELCIESRCVRVREMHCADDADCVSGMICGDAFTCVARFACRSDKDCYQGERCYPISGCGLVLEGSPCETTKDCGLNMFCLLNKCTRDDKTKMKSRPCNDVNQCAPPSLCDLHSMSCMSPKIIQSSSSSSSLSSSSSSSSTCSSITECAQDYACVHSKCVYAGKETPCKGTPDCAQNFKCVNKFCQVVTPFASCKKTVQDCGNLQRCSKSTCISSPNQSTCKKTSHCGVSQICDKTNQLCVDVPVGTRCGSSSSCGLGEQCVRGKCASLETAPTPCPKRDTPQNARAKCTSKRCTYSCNNNLELNGHSVSTCLPNATWDHPPPACALPYTCAPETSHLDEESCLAEGYCSCRIPISPDTLQRVPLSSNSTAQGCAELVEESTGKPCVWKPANVWLPGKGKMCLFYAIKRRDRVGVRSLLASGEDANSRQGIEGCLPGPGDIGYGSEPDPVQIASSWCLAARDRRPIDVAIQSKDPMIVKMLQMAGGLTGKRPNIGERAVGYPYRWARLMEPLNRT